MNLYVDVCDSIVPFNISINAFRIVLSSAVILIVFSPVTTAAISPELSSFGGLRVIVYENRTGTVTFERKLLTTISRIG